MCDVVSQGTTMAKRSAQRSAKRSAKRSARTITKTKIVDALSLITKPFGTTFTKKFIQQLQNHPVLRNEHYVSEAVARMSVEQVEDRLLDIGERYRQAFETNRLFDHDTREFIRKTRLYQLVDTTHQWVAHLILLRDNPRVKNTLRRTRRYDPRLR